MNNQEEYTKCCTHYNTDEYLDGYIIIKPIKIKYCKNCGEVHLVANKFWSFIFEYFLSHFWTGKIYINNGTYNDLRSYEEDDEAI